MKYNKSQYCIVIEIKNMSDYNVIYSQYYKGGLQYYMRKIKVIAYKKHNQHIYTESVIDIKKITSQNVV